MFYLPIIKNLFVHVVCGEKIDNKITINRFVYNIQDVRNVDHQISDKKIYLSGRFCKFHST